MDPNTARAWEEAKSVFDHGTLVLSRAQLVEARRAARPFVQLVGRRFLDGLDDRILLRTEVTKEVVVLLKGWGEQMQLRYPRSAPKKGSRLRHRFDSFEMKLPTGERRLMLKFSLGVGLRSEESWRLIEWWLGTWGGKQRVESQAMPVLRDIHRQVPELRLEFWRDIIGPWGSWAHVGRMVPYTEFGGDIEKSVEMVASDLRRLLDAAEEYREL